MAHELEVFWFSEQPYGHVTEDDLAPYESGRMHFPNTYFDPEKAHVLYSNYHDQYQPGRRGGFRRHHVQRAPQLVLVHEAVGERGRRRHHPAHQEGQDRHAGQRHRGQRSGEDGPKKSPCWTASAAGASSPASCAARRWKRCTPATRRLRTARALRRPTTSS